jgi:hypothetical protein
MQGAAETAVATGRELLPTGGKKKLRREECLLTPAAGAACGAAGVGVGGGERDGGEGESEEEERGRLSSGQGGRTQLSSLTD